MFTVAQILRGVSLSELHFHTPLGAGGAGAPPRRVRTAYSQTRCLPHPRGWASAPTGRLCAALAGRSLWACKVTIRTAGRCGSVYPAFFSNPLLCPHLGHFAERKCTAVRFGDGRKTTGSRKTWPVWSSSNSPCTALSISESKLLPQQRRTKALTPSFSFWKCPDATQPAGAAQTASQGRHGGLCLEARLKTRFTLLAEIILSEKLLATFHFSETFREHQLWGRKLLFDYSGVNFSKLPLSKSNFSDIISLSPKGLSLVVMRLVYLFPPQILEGVPSIK